MKITQLDIKEFCEVLKEFKEEVSKNLDEWAEEGDHIEVMLNSVNILTKELKGIGSLDDLSLEKKKILFPHISFVYNYMNYLTGEDSFEDDFFDDFGDEEDDEDDMEEWDEEEEWESSEEEQEEPKHDLKVIPKKQKSCCEESTCKTTKPTTKPTTKKNKK